MVPTGTTKFEKRGIAVKVPEWIPENCVQCGQCSLVCPHACIRPILVKEGTEVPASFVTKKAIGKEVAGYTYRMQVSPLTAPAAATAWKCAPPRPRPWK